MKRRRSMWKIVRAHDGWGRESGWNIYHGSELVAEFVEYPISYRWLQKTVALWKSLEKERKSK